MNADERRFVIAYPLSPAFFDYNIRKFYTYTVPKPLAAFLGMIRTELHL